MAERILGVFGTVSDPAYFPTIEKAAQLEAPLRAKGIAAEVVLEGNVDWDGASFPMGRRVIIVFGRRLNAVLSQRLADDPPHLLSSAHRAKHTTRSRRIRPSYWDS
jgi:hypothetical protein